MSSYCCHDDYSYDSEEDIYYHENTATRIRSKMQLDRYEVFKAQDQEKGHFDCELEIDGKKLYCHKFVLASASETFNALLSDRWNDSKDGIIKVENPGYTYESYYEFLCFLYSGECDINDENIYVLTDMAEYYGVQYLRDCCEDFLADMAVTVANIEQLVEFAEKFSMDELTSVLRSYICENFKEIIDDERFVEHKKPFIQLLSHLLGKSECCSIFDAVCKWAEYQATIKKTKVKEECFNVQERIKSEMNGILQNIKLANMSLWFICNSVANRCFLFSTAEIYQMIIESNRSHNDEQHCFKLLYCIAEDVTKVKNPALANDDNEFNLQKAIKAELADILPNIRFHYMPYKFLMKFVVEKGFDFSLARLYQYLTNPEKENDDEEVFKAVYEIAEKQVLMQQLKSPDPDFNLTNAINIRMEEVLSNVKYHRMSIDFLMNFMVEKGLFLSPVDICNYFNMVPRNRFGTYEDAFIAIYELAEKQVLMKQEVSPDPNFNLSVAVKCELAYILPKIKFYELNSNFILDFIVENGILSKEEAVHVYDLCVKVKNDGLSIIATFEDNYGIMKTFSTDKQYTLPQAWNKQRISYKKFEIPLTPSTVMKMKGVDWYLCFEKDGALTVKHQTMIKKSDYLIAEMKPNFNGEFMFNTQISSCISARYKNV